MATTSRDNFMSATDAAKIAASKHASYKANDNRIKDAAIASVLEDTKSWVKQRSKEGYFDVDSPNLADPSYREGSSYTQDKMEDILAKAIREFFQPLGYVVTGSSNYLNIAWGTKEQIAEADALLDREDK